MQSLGSKKIGPCSDKPPQTTANRVSENWLATLGHSPKNNRQRKSLFSQQRRKRTETGYGIQNRRSRVGLEVEGKTEEKQKLDSTGYAA